MFLKCIHNCSPIIYVADLWQQPFSPAVNEYRIPKAYRMLPSIFLKAGVSHGTLASLKSLWPTDRRGGSSVWPHTPSLSCPDAYYSNPPRCWEGVLILIWKYSPPTRADQYVSCLSPLLTFLLHSETLLQGAIDGSNLQQPAASHVRQST